MHRGIEDFGTWPFVIVIEQVSGSRAKKVLAYKALFKGAQLSLKSAKP
tara:strand:+ start:108 stop:251 length:144 start_codon:yes stop_codon:yes gene_type:complete